VKQLTWTPRRRGNIYCSPACGRGCTIREFRKARCEARKLAMQLSSTDTDVRGGHWTIDVWENLGWHWKVVKGSVEVRKTSRLYSAGLNVVGPWGGNMWCDGKTPQEAVSKLLSATMAQLEPMIALNNRLKG